MISTRNLSIAVGLCGTLIGCISSLDSLSSPETIQSKVSSSLLCLFYGGVLWLLLTSVTNHGSDFKADSETPGKSNRKAVIFWLTVIVLAFYLRESLLLLIYIDAMMWFFGILFFLLLVDKHKKHERLEKISFYSSRIAVCTALFCCIIIFGSNEDPTRIGPAMAMGLHFLLYGNVILVIEKILRQAPSERNGLQLLLPTSLTFIVLSNLFYLDFEFNWHFQKKMDDLNRSKIEQDRLLRRLVLQNPQPSGELLTVSTDKEAWIFVDGILQGQAPLYQFVRSGDEHVVHIATCPNSTRIMNNTETVSFLEYWHTASDGSCDTPTEDDVRDLINGGQITKQMISETDSIQHFEFQWGPEVNFCCDAHLTKKFTVPSARGHLVYDWSFEKRDWRSHPMRTTQPNQVH